VLRDVARQIASGTPEICGVMFESFLVAGRQNVGSGLPLVYGQSITDGCLDWESTEPLLKELAGAVRQRRQVRVGVEQEA
jgi:3-deoxy-7-phosphoheptulonate synthase